MRHCLPNFNLNRAKAYLVSITLLVEGSTISAQTYESASSGVPQNISELKGEEISFQNYNAYTSVERPWEYDKMLLLYNVGSGKFLNVGSYCGTHATLTLLVSAQKRDLAQVYLGLQALSLIQQDRH